MKMSAHRLPGFDFDESPPVKRVKPNRLEIKFHERLN